VSLLLLRTEGDRAVSVAVDGREEEPVHRRAARELARLADLAPGGHVAWMDRRIERRLNAPAAWPALLRHGLEVLHAGGGSRMARSLGLVDFDSPWLLDGWQNRRFDTWLISPAAGIARGAVLQGVGLEPHGWGFAAALFDLGRRGIRHGLCPVSDPGLLRESLPEEVLRPLRPVEIARLIRRGYGRRWVAFWLAGARRGSPFAALRGGLAPEAPEPDLDTLRPVLPDMTGEGVDVLVPTFGRPGHLQVLLDDLAAQTLRPRRVVVVEQGEPAPGLAAGNWPFELRLLRLPRPGACRARNAGLAELRSERVLLLDDDVRLRPRLIERLVAVARGYGAEVVNARVHLPHQEPSDPGPPRPWPSFSSGAALASTALLREAGGFDERLEGGYGEDWEMGVRLRLHGAAVLYDAAEPILHLKAPAGGFRTGLPLPWELDAVPPRPSPFVLYARRKHLTPEMMRGYRLYHGAKRLGATPFWRWPVELRRLSHQWERSEHWAGRLAEEAP